jgi:hypothetical protein
MQEIIAPVSDMTFDIEIALEHQLGSLPLPFPGMDSMCLNDLVKLKVKLFSVQVLRLIFRF